MTMMAREVLRLDASEAYQRICQCIGALYNTSACAFNASFSRVSRHFPPLMFLPPTSPAPVTTVLNGENLPLLTLTVQTVYPNAKLISSTF